MKLNPAQGSGPGARSESPRGGIAGRVEAAAKLRAPPPKGRGLVLMILAVVVLGALVWDFTGHGAASRAVTRSVEGARPVAAPGGDEDPGAAAGPGTLMLALRLGDGTLSMSAADAVARLQGLEGAERTAFLLPVLESLGLPAGRRGAQAREAFEVAARFVDGAGPEAERALGRLRLLAWAALATDDVAAPAAILFLRQLPDSGGPDTMLALDEVILDPKRPLSLRVEAARARSKEGRPPELDALAADPATHPSLGDALR